MCIRDRYHQVKLMIMGAGTAYTDDAVFDMVKQLELRSFRVTFEDMDLNLLDYGFESPRELMNDLEKLRECAPCAMVQEYAPKCIKLLVEKLVENDVRRQFDSGDRDVPTANEFMEAEHGKTLLPDMAQWMMGACDALRTGENMRKIYKRARQQ